MSGSGRGFTLIWIVAFALLVGNTVLSTSNVFGLIENDRRVLHTRTVKQELTNLLSDLKDAETGQRGFQITGERGYLEPYDRGVERIALRQAELQTLLTDDPEQSGRLASLNEAVAAKLGEMKRVLDLYAADGPDAARKLIATGKGKAHMDDVRERVALIDRREDETLRQRSAVAEAKYRATLLSAAGGGAAMVVMVALASWLVRQELVRRRLAEGDARLTAAALAASQRASADTLAQLDAFLDHAPVGIAFLDSQLRYRRVNQTLAAAHGVPVAGHIGRRAEEVATDFSADLVADFMKVLATGKPILGRETRHPKDGVAWEVTLFPVASPHPGHPGGLGAITRDVTERTLAEGRLRESETRFRTLADAMPQLVWVTRADGSVEYFNSRWYEYTHLTPGESLGAGWAVAIHPDDLPRTYAAWHATTARGTPYDIEYRLRDKAAGTYRWFKARARAVREPDTGAVERWFGTCTDVDDFKRLEASLQASESRFRTLAESVPAVVWTATPTGQLDYLNDRFTQFTGLPPEETLGDGWVRTVHPDDLPGVAARWRACLETGDPYLVEFRMRAAGGGYCWFYVQAVPARGPDGGIARWHGTCTDITDFKLASQEAQLNAQRFRLLTESIPQMVWNADHAGQATYFNSRWQEYTGLTQAAAVADWWAQVLHPADAVAAEADWKRLIAGDQDAMTAELRVRRASDGAYRWFLAEVVPLRRPDGTVDQWIGSLSDIDDQKRLADRLTRLVRERTFELERANTGLHAEVAERRRAEQREQAAAVELRRSNEELEKFAYVASHDLQEPLRKIQAFGERLAVKFRAGLGEQGQDYIDRMKSSAGRMQTLINDLLAFSRVTSRTHPFTPVDLNESLRQALADLEERLSQAGGRVDVGPLPTLPGDATQLRQLFQNLLGNALKFARPGVPPVVSVAAGPRESGGSGCLITVQDNGIGFEQTFAERIFEVFQRLHGRQEYEGTGIGLAICRKIVERHGGTIVARSTLGEGATFLIDWPDNPTPSETPPA